MQHAAPHPRPRTIAWLTALIGVLAVLGSLAVPRLASAAAGHNPVGTFDKADLVMPAGNILLDGWAADADAPTTGLQVNFYDNGVRVAAQMALGVRADVGRAYPTYGNNHGFTYLLAVADGTHQLCVTAWNRGAGATATLGCRTVVVHNSPLGRVERTAQVPGGIAFAGWTFDPNSTAATTVRVYVDKGYQLGLSANQARADVGRAYPAAGGRRGFSMVLPLTVGTHNVCVYAINTGAGYNTTLSCVTVTRGTNPTGTGTVSRVGSTDTVTATGWVLDPDSLNPLVVRLASDGVGQVAGTANVASPAAAAAWPAYGANHGFSLSAQINGYEHRACVIGYNVGTGANTSLNCVLLQTTGSLSPATPSPAVAWPGPSAASLNWTAPRSVAAAITGYQITITPGNRVVTTTGAGTSTVIGGLTNGTKYTFSIRALNSYGRSSAVLALATPSNIPPQLTPAPVSTSHYIRNITGNLTTDAAQLRTMGAVDAANNPSGHSYLVLLQIGGQDESRHGALLSAIARYVPYAAVVSAMKAYADGYHSKQKPYAPMTLAIGTNNDVDVSAAAGYTWAHTIVQPVSDYVAPRYSGITVAGANDMEPGFSASVGQTRAWLAGYLTSTKLRFVFNGSADGCSTTKAGSSCNNHWSMADLQWLSGGADPSRIMSLPQIYNSAMPNQWKNISLTGTNAGLARIYFGGPLTEVTACDQAGSCGSISNVVAWAKLWAAISSSAATRQASMPHGTDLRIN